MGVSGTKPYSFQWWRDGVALGGETNACLARLNAQSTNYQVVVDNPAKQPVTSSIAPLVVFGTNSVPPYAVMGSVRMSNGCFIVTGSGKDIEGNEDRFYFVYTPLKGDGQIVVRFGGMAPDNSESEAGLMLREGFGGGDRHAFLALNAANETIFRRRHVADLDSLENRGRSTNYGWLRLMRMGDTLTGHYSTNGLNWALVWWTTMTNMSNTLQAGLAVTVHRNNGINTATFCNVSIGGLTPIPGPWPEAGPRIWLSAEPAACSPMSQFGGFKMLIGGVVGEQYEVLASPVVKLQSFPPPPGHEKLDKSTFTTSLWRVTNSLGVVPFMDTGALTNRLNQFYLLRKVAP